MGGLKKKAKKRIRLGSSRSSGSGGKAWANNALGKKM